MKKLLLLLILFSLNLATASMVSFNFNPTQDSSQGNTNTIYYEDSIVFQVITTPHQVLCRHSTIKDTPFDAMSGFQDNFETIHKQTLTNLHDGVYKYYVKCRPIDDLNNASTGIAQLEAIFKISNPIAAQIVLGDSVLKSGKHEISIVTTKVPASTPTLKYSYDGIVYTPIVLHGSGNSWKGFLIIPTTVGEEIGSFKFEARDLEGRTGTGIIGDNIFTVDTKAPPAITSIEASGEYNRIKLEWFLDEDEEIEKIKIYRSESPNVDLTNLHKTLNEDKEEYYDTDVKDGKTYYYRITTEDAAENMADLSREVVATSLLSKTTSSTGLSPLLIGSVDALISEIESLENDIRSTDIMISSLTEEERNHLKTLKITDNFASAKSELTILKRNVEEFKLTDVTKEILDGRLSSSRVKMTIIKKKIPDTLSKIESSETTFNPTEDTLRKAILEYKPELTPGEIDKTIEISMESFEEKNIKIKSKINTFETIYMDGSKTTQSIIEHFLEGKLERKENSKLILQFPSGSLDLTSLSVKNFDYTPEQEGLISFESDTEKISYTIDQKLDANILKEISISLVTSQEKSVSITGYFLSSVPSGGSTIASLLIILASGLIGYLFFIKQKQGKEVSLSFLEKAKQVKALQKEGKIEEADKMYGDLKVEYMSLSKGQKHKVFKEIKHLTKK